MSNMALARLPITRALTFHGVKANCFLHLPYHITSIFKPTHMKPRSHLIRTLNTLIDNNGSTKNHSSFSQHSTLSSPIAPHGSYRWRPMCLYYTQGKCTKMDDPAHLEIFNHDCSRDLVVRDADFERKKPQEFDYFLVLDLEGKVEILEFPVLLIDANTMAVVDLFHRFVRPSAMTDQHINEYIANKYGKFGVDCVWHDTALPFTEVISQFEAWLIEHHLWEKQDGRLHRAAFVTWYLEILQPGGLLACGNWDVKTQIPHQCKVSKMKLAPYFMEWINLKDAYKNFYKPKKEARGMRTMMEQLKISMLGNHHLGIDDAKNIARVLLRMLADGAVIRITARRSRNYPENVSFTYKNRVR